MKKIMIGMTVAAMALGASMVALKAQAPARNVWDGVFTEAQANRGKVSFEKECSNCHNQDLNGNVRGPALKGEKFLADWLNGSVNTLFMPLVWSFENVSRRAKIGTDDRWANCAAARR